MATLELECPGCGEVLELDAGFAGGVCRCSNCGTLMTVPTESGAGAEKLERPERPDAPGGRPESPTSATAETTTAPAGDADAPAETEAKAEVEAELEDESAEQAGEATFTTASGRTVHVDTHAHIPTAEKKQRPMVRAVTAGVIVVVMLVMVGLVGYATVTFLSGPADDDASEAATAQFGYDPSVNIYSLEKANVIGLPLRQRTAIIVDASGDSRRWLTLTQDALRVGLTGADSDAQVGLIYATEAEPSALTEEPQAISELTPKQVHDFQSQISAAGVAPLTPAIERALEWSPKHIVLITGRALDSEQVDSINALLDEQASGESGGAIVLDVVLIDQRSDALSSLAESHGGRLVQMTQSQLVRWFRRADVPMP